MATISFEAQSYFKRYEQLVLPTVMALLVVVLTSVVLVPQSLGAIDDFKSLGELRAQLSLLSQKATVLQNLDGAELTVRSREMIADVPLDEDLGYFVGGVRSMVERAGVTLSSVELVGATEVRASASAQLANQSATGKVNVRTTSLGKQGQFIPLKVGVGGALLAVRQFLTEVNSSVPLTEIQEFNFGRAQGENVFNGSTLLHFFYSSAPLSLGASDQMLPVITAAEENTYEQLAQFHEPEMTTLPEVQTGQTEFIR